MPDITLCTNKDCPISDKCFRFNCKPSEHIQSFDRFEPRIRIENDGSLDVKCDMFLSIKSTKK